MTPDQRFALIMFALGVMATTGGWICRRIVNTQDQRWKIVEKLAQQDTADRAEKPQWERRMDRCEGAIAKLLEVVTEFGLQMARHEGWHDRHQNPADTEPKMGG